MHLSFAYVGLVLAASAAASSHHTTRASTVARLNARGELDPTHEAKLDAKCFGGQGCNGLSPPGSRAIFNQPVVCPVAVLEQNQFFSYAQTYTVITTNTVHSWGGVADTQTILVQWQLSVLSFSTLVYGLRDGCHYQQDPKIVMSTFPQLFIQFQSMLTIITRTCGGDFSQFQPSFTAFSVVMEAFIGIAITMQVNIQQLFSSSQFDPSIWQGCGFPARAWLGGSPGQFGGPGFPGTPGKFNPGVGPDVYPDGPGNGHGGFLPPGGSGGFFPGGGGTGQGAIGFFYGLSFLDQLLLALINLLEPIFHGIGQLLEGLGLALEQIGGAVGDLLHHGGGHGGTLIGLI